MQEKQMKQSLKQFDIHASKMKNMWSVLPASFAASMLNQLFETSIITPTCNAIIAKPDIQEHEANHLKSLLQSLLDTLVTVCDTLPSLKKLIHLQNVLSWKMVDIVEHFVNGEFKSFTSSEMEHLILAIFDDTPKRDDALRKIRNK